MSPMTRKYVVRTYGCQMNEHDSERIAGLFDADGMDQADSEDDADVIVLNTCSFVKTPTTSSMATFGA